jgi:hypothetical protein
MVLGYHSRAIFSESLSFQLNHFAFKDTKISYREADESGIICISVIYWKAYSNPVIRPFFHLSAMNVVHNLLIP